ncbi:MAG TPA: alkaline phosphatase family protein [Thermoanaerobaculia bacterium]|nr:alkaline phosphatase family protein [Thermoanaerobaculia bacterium]
MRPLLLTLALLSPGLFVRAEEPAAAKADLAVVISVDQLRFDYVERFAPWLTTRGFQRFAREGATFPNARFPYSVTFTGPGHAAIGTGLVPAESGITGNSWFERDAPVDVASWRWYFDDITPYRAAHVAEATFDGEGAAWWKEGGGSPRYCAYDDRVTVTAGKTTGMSPSMMAEESLGERVKARYPGSRVISAGFKDRAVILMGGRHADAAYWFDYRTPAFLSSSWYRFNPEVLAFNALIPGYVPASARWTPGPYIPPDDLKRLTFDPPEAWPLKNNTYEGTFPHPIKTIRALTYTPFMHQMLFDFAHHVIATERLGSRSGTPDVLFVAISSTDYVGHYYGPESMEVADSMVRLDRALAGFLDTLERRFGNRVVVALTSDHGVQPNPEIVKLRDPNADAGRLDVRTPVPHARNIADLPPARIEIEEKLARKLGVQFDRNAPLSHALLYFFEEPGFWLNRPRVRALGLDPERTKRALRDVMRSLKHHGVADAWTSTDLLTPNPTPTRLEQLMRASYRSDRSPDVLMALRPGWIWSWGSNSTTHGQPVENDMHVPLMFWGAGIKPGVYEGNVSPLDVARTLGALLGVEAGGEETKVLVCVEAQAASVD